MKIAVLDDYQNILGNLVDWSRIPQSSVQIFTDHLADLDELTNRLAEFDVIVGFRERTPFKAPLLDRLPRLKLLITLGMANPSFDIAHATKLGIMVCGTQASGVDPIEMTWALILAAARNLPFEERKTRQGEWQVTLGTRLAGKTLGILGLGRIGAAVAKIAPAFQMPVIAWSDNLTEDKAKAAGAELVSRQELFERSDVLSVNLRLSPRTRDLVGAAELASMKPSAFLVNTARGELIDEAALIQALRNKRIRGAALDVFHVEPLPKDHPFLTMDNVIVSPHLGGVTWERYISDYNEVIDDIVGFIEGKHVRVLNPDVPGNLRK